MPRKLSIVCRSKVSRPSGTARLKRGLRFFRPAGARRMRNSYAHLSWPRQHGPLLKTNKREGARTFNGPHSAEPSRGACQPSLLFAIAVEEKHSRSPHSAKPMEPCRMFLDMSSYGQEMFVDELTCFLVFIRFGIQPSTSPSSWSRAEVHQDSSGLLFGCG
jgi:hypothetical protein